MIFLGMVPKSRLVTFLYGRIGSVQGKYNNTFSGSQICLISESNLLISICQWQPTGPVCRFYHQELNP
jgi:hypothetical protein